MPATAGGAGLVGRERELAALDDALARGATGTAVVVAAVGEPGIGKTSLLGELRARAEAGGWLVVGGRAGEFERDEPFGVFVEALDEPVVRAERQLLRRLGSETLAELAAMLPGLEQAGYAPPSRLQSERFRVHRAVRILLEALAAQRPLLMVLDDLHWADEASLELWGALVRRRPTARMVLAGALRPRQAPRQLSEAVAAGDIVRLEPGPLDAATAKAMLAGIVDDATAETLHRESGGVPFYLEQLARAPAGLIAPQTAGTAGLDVPAAVTRALAGELETLGEPARELLRGAAVAGDPFDPVVAAATAGVDERVALTVLDELVAADLVRETGEPRRLKFRHPIVRHAVYESAGPGWRLAAHGRAAAALAAAGSPPLARAHHVAISAQRGDPGAFQLLAEAAQAAAPKSPAVAAHWFGEALRLLPDGEDGWRLGLLGLRAQSLAAGGRLEASRAALLEALPLVPPEAGEIRVRLVAGCAWAELLLGRPGEAEARLLGVLEELPATSTEAASVLVELAAGRLFHGDFAGAVDPAGRARELAAAAGDRLLEATATVLEGFGSLGMGNMPAAHGALDAAARFVAEIDDAALASRIDTPIFYLGHLAFWADRYGEGVAWFERGMAVSRLSGFGHVLVPLMAGHAHTLVALGRLEAADKLASASVDAARLTGNPHDLAWALWIRCWCSLHRGDMADALRAGEESVDLVRGLEHSNASVAASWALGAALLENGEPARATEVILDIAGGPDLPRLAPAARCIAYDVLVRSALAEGRVTEASRWAAQAGDAATGLGSGTAAGLALRARAAVILAEDDAGDGADIALRAAECLASTGARIEEARARVLAGRALAAAGVRDRAAAELEAARFALAACDARRWRDEAARELRALGRHVARRGEAARGTGPGTLSRREREVAELVAAGRTNKQIAAALYITENTVESHLRRVFAKLDVTNRAGLASVFAARTAQAGESARHEPHSI